MAISRSDLDLVPSAELERTMDLQILVKQSEQQHGSTNGYIGYTGKLMVATPGELLFDRALADSDRVYWCILRLLCQEQGNVNLIPDQSLLAERMEKSRGSIITYSKMLRATRWITVIDVQRENNLPTRYSYAIHDTPLSLEEVMRIDSDYLPFIIQASQDKAVSRLAQYCSSVIEALDTDIVQNMPLDSLHHFRSSRKIPLTSVQNSDSDNPNCQKSDSENAPVVQKSDSGEISVVQKTDSESNPVVQNPDSENASVVQKSDSGGNPVVQNPDSGEIREDIYNTARVPADAVTLHAHAPTQSRIIPFGNNDNHPSFQDRGYGGKDEPSRFAFLDEKPYRLLTERLVALYGNHNAHAVLNALKRGSYTYRAQSFRHTITADEAGIILVSLIDRDKDSPVQSPLDYTVSLIHRAHGGELCFVGKQYRRFLELSGQAEPEAPQQAGNAPIPLPPLPNGTRLVGKSGTEYQIVSGGLLTLEETIVPNKSDGLSCRIPDMDEIQALIAEGRLIVVSGGEQ